MGEKKYNAAAWSDDVDSLPGELRFGDNAVHFVAAAHVIDLDYTDLELDIRGGKSPRVSLSNSDRSDWTVEVGGHAVLANRALRGRTPIRRQIEEFEDQKDGFKRLLITVMFFVGFIGLSALAGVMVESAMPKLVALVPPSYEQQMTLDVMDEVRLSLPEEYVETNALAQLNALVDRIFPPDRRGEYEFDLTLMDHPAPNAFAMPGGKIFIYTGLLENADTTEEVAGVLAHEVAHVMQRHGLRQIMANAGPSLIFDRVLGSDDGFLSAVAAGSSFLVRQNFSRSHESEADDVAFDYLVAAGIDPRGLESFLQKASSGEGDLSAFRAFLSHPPSPERIQALRMRWRERKQKPVFEKLEKLEFEAPVRPEMSLSDLVDKLLDR